MQSHTNVTFQDPLNPQPRESTNIFTSAINISAAIRIITRVNVVEGINNLSIPDILNDCVSFVV